MAKWTISEYSHLPKDAGGNILPVYGKPRVSAAAAAGGTTNLNAGTRYVRICGDTAFHAAIGAAATTATRTPRPAPSS
jgi:hypothetical protein